jgi:hypothetical protein
MSLRKPWHDLDRVTVRKAPDRYGVYELGDDSGESIRLDAGVLGDELKEALSRGSATKVRWTEATSKEHAERLPNTLDPSKQREDDPTTHLCTQSKSVTRRAG